MFLITLLDDTVISATALSIGSDATGPVLVVRDLDGSEVLISVSDVASITLD